VTKSALLGAPKRAYRSVHQQHNTNGRIDKSLVTSLVLLKKPDMVAKPAFEFQHGITPAAGDDTAF
jgi:hypothetical protein